MVELTGAVVLSCGAADVCAFCVQSLFRDRDTVCGRVNGRRSGEGSLCAHTETQGKEVGEEVDLQKQTRLRHSVREYTPRWCVIALCTALCVSE